jgi:hypothetical protein
MNTLKLHCSFWLAVWLASLLSVWLGGWVAGWLGGWVAGWLDGWQSSESHFSLYNFCFALGQKKILTSCLVSLVHH